MANIFQNPGIKNNPEKGRYSDPIIPGMGSPYNKRGCKSSYKQVSPKGTMPATVEDDYQEEGRRNHVKHPTLTVGGKPLEYNPKFDPNKLITDQSEKSDRESQKSNNKQTASQVSAFGPDSKLAKENPAKAANIFNGIKSNNKQVFKNPMGRGINTLQSQDNQKPCNCAKKLDNCNCG